MDVSPPSEPYWAKEKGVAPIKSEFVLWDRMETGQRRIGVADDDAAERDINRTVPPTTSAMSASDGAAVLAEDGPNTEERPKKKQKLTGGEEKSAKAGAAGGKKETGGRANHNRTFAKTNDGPVQLCSYTAMEQECDRCEVGEEKQKNNVKDHDGQDRTQNGSASGEEGNQTQSKGVARAQNQRGKPTGCRFSHDLKAYFASKPPPLRTHLGYTFSGAQTFPRLPLPPSTTAHPLSADVPSETQCPLFGALGKCHLGFRCRFLDSHVERVPEGHGFQGSEFRLLVDGDKVGAREATNMHVGAESNKLTHDIQFQLRKKRFDLSGTAQYLQAIGEPMDTRSLDHNGRRRGRNKAVKVSTDKAAITPPVGERGNSKGDEEAAAAASADGTADEPASRAKELAIDLTRPRAAEKHRLHWSGKLYLAPLTTNGNLPFRRLCTDLGADITCGEMALGQDLLTGSPSEWSLVRRHESEKVFGVQVAGSRPQVLVATAELLAKTCNVDFVDVNCGCPIDLVFRKGAGSALLDHANRLGRSLIGMSNVLGSIPLTFKLRTGILDSVNVAHKLLGRAQKEWGAGAVTLHGRSRQQRYTKRADWEYIKECAQVVHQAVEEDDVAPIPIFGNGDCYDYRDYYQNMEQSGVDGIMIARGALIKPWLFTEIKERRDWDISSRERLDMYGKLASHGLEHWGSDTQGINTTRRFLCEAMSFQHRYVPVGLLERLPARINERPLPYKGRDELETLLASPSAEDWVKISNLFLGPPPEGWYFTPKHKSNAFEGTENG